MNMHVSGQEQRSREVETNKLKLTHDNYVFSTTAAKLKSTKTGPPVIDGLRTKQKSPGPLSSEDDMSEYVPTKYIECQLQLRHGLNLRRSRCGLNLRRSRCGLNLRRSRCGLNLRGFKCGLNLRVT
ncbi:hypothetical protein V1264_007281 [Littorina saxatilis]|uniref:Uncharacterized protein n=1 Tax=Littorina saxatilis TaxID=31220 RepID=A0AAN9AUI1_9CAEN